MYSGDGASSMPVGAHVEGGVGLGTQVEYSTANVSLLLQRAVVTSDEERTLLQMIELSHPTNDVSVSQLVNLAQFLLTSEQVTGSSLMPSTGHSTEIIH